jgi:carbon starvation protein
VATGLIVAAASGMTFYEPGGQGAMVLWPLFGSLNQLIGALALGVVTIYLAARKIPVWYTLLPMVVILVLTLWAMVENLAGFLHEREWLLVVLSAIIFGLTAWLTLSSLVVLREKIADRIST